MDYYRRNIFCPLIPPFPLNFDTWTTKQSDEYLSWFVSHIHERSEYILDFISSDDKDIVLPRCDSPEVLLAVWRWLLKIACVEPVPQDILDKQKSSWAVFGDGFVSKIRLDIFTEYVLRDIAMLVSDIFTSNHTALYWGYDSKPKKYIFRNHPVIKGFLDTRYEKPFQAVFEPVHMVGVQASKILDHTAKETDLLEIYKYWEK